MAERELDAAVVGAGVIGLAITRELHGRGARVARIVADAVTGEPDDPALGILDPARSGEGRRVPESQLV